MRPVFGSRRRRTRLSQRVSRQRGGYGQKARDAEYEREYRAWIDSLPPDERLKLEAQGLAAPCLAHHGNGSTKGDAADSPIVQKANQFGLMSGYTHRF